MADLSCHSDLMMVDVHYLRRQAEMMCRLAERIHKAALFVGWAAVQSIAGTGAEASTRPPLIPACADERPVEPVERKACQSAPDDRSRAAWRNVSSRSRR